ncbi:MAG: glycosyltransferase [Planctomycetales bacterium]|nr:glycosyltransferase [Planctomycetales bacterium]
MKLYFLSTERGWHGGEEQLRLLIEAARAAGHECRIAARAGGAFATRMQEAGFTVDRLAGNVRGPRSAWRVRRAVRWFRPQTLHANDPHALSLMNLAAWGLPRAARGGPLRIAARRVLFPIRSTGKYAACDRVICVSHAIAQVCRDSGLPDHLLAVVHDGVDPARMAAGDAARGRAALGLAADVPLVLCVAQLAAYKGHRYLLDAWPAVRTAHPAAVLALAGDGPLRAELQQQAAALGVGDSVRLLGYRNDVPDLVQACDLFALASPEEGLGTSVLDAMFAQRAVVGANAGGIPEMLADDAGGQCGWLATPRDAAALTQAITAALSDAGERQRRAELGFIRAGAEFTAAVMASRTLRLYDQLLATQTT